MEIKQQQQEEQYDIDETVKVFTDDTSETVKVLNPVEYKQINANETDKIVENEIKISHISDIAHKVDKKSDYMERVKKLTSLDSKELTNRKELLDKIKTLNNEFGTTIDPEDKKNEYLIYLYNHEVNCIKEYETCNDELRTVIDMLRNLNYEELMIVFKFNVLESTIKYNQI